MTTETKVCTQCRKELPIGEFPKLKGVIGGEQYCFFCVSYFNRQWVRNHVDRDAWTTVAKYRKMIRKIIINETKKLEDKYDR